MFDALLIDWHFKAINNTMDFTEGDGEVTNSVDDWMVQGPPGYRFDDWPATLWDDISDGEAQYCVTCIPQ